MNNFIYKSFKWFYKKLFYYDCLFYLIKKTKNKIIENSQY